MKKQHDVTNVNNLKLFQKFQHLKFCVLSDLVTNQPTREPSSSNSLNRKIETPRYHVEDPTTRTQTAVHFNEDNPRIKFCCGGNFIVNLAEHLLKKCFQTRSVKTVEKEFQNVEMVSIERL